jgi:hypothetical protein
VKLRVQLAPSPVVAVPIGANVLGEHARAAFPIDLTEPPRRLSHGQRLERQPRLVRVPQIVHREPADAGAAVRDVLGEAEHLELPDGLADGHRAHVERARELLEAQRRARRELAVEDRLLQLHGRLLGQRSRSRQCHLEQFDF